MSADVPPPPPRPPRYLDVDATTTRAALQGLLQPQQQQQQQGDHDTSPVVEQLCFDLGRDGSAAVPIRIAPLPSERSVETEIQLFRRFAPALEASRGLRYLYFRNQDFGRSEDDDGDDGGGDDDVDNNEIGGDGRPRRHLSATSYRRDYDVDQLFGQVLPNHPALSYVALIRCGIPTRAFRAYMMSLGSSGAGANTLRRLNIEKCRISGEGIRSVAEMIRANGSLRALCLKDWIDPRGQGVGTIGGNHDVDVDHHESCRILLDAVANHPRLGRLCVEDALLRIDAGGAALAMGPGSSKLYCLNLRGRFTPDGIVDLIFRLRTNETLEQVIVTTEHSREVAPSLHRLADDLLTTYNCTLERVWLGNQGERAWFVGWGDKNRPAGIARQHLQHSNYAISGPASVWPRVLQHVNRFPTLVYRFLRRGNAPALAEHLSSMSRATTTPEAPVAPGSNRTLRPRPRVSTARARPTRRRRLNG